MDKKLVTIVQECIEQIINAKRFDHIYDYFSEQCLFHTPPYVGLGIYTDETSGKEIVIKRLAANAPASGKVQAGDVLLRASDDNNAWEGYEKLRTGFWGQGKLGTEVKLTVLRDGETHEVTIRRGKVEDFSNILADVRDGWQHYLLEVMPDLHSEMNQIMVSGDFVAYYATNTGTSTIHRQSAVWAECNILRLQHGKIIEWWGVEDFLSQRQQLGYRMVEPAK